MGQRLLDQPLFFTKHGKPVYPIKGGATDDDPFPADAGDSGDDDEDEGQEGTPDSGSADREGEDTKKKGDPRIQELSRENAKHRNKNKELAGQLEELQKQLKSYTDKDKTETEKAASRVGELEELSTKLATEVENLRLENAFFKQQDFKFRNPAIARKLVDLSEVEFDDEGNAVGLREALEKLKKTDPYLFADSQESNDDEDSGSVPAKTGEKPNARKSNGQMTREALLRKYPALQR